MSDRLVFSTDAKIASLSNGSSVRRSITSTSTPSFASRSAASSDGDDHRAIGQKRRVVALAPDGGHADRHDLVTFGHRTLRAAIQILVLEVHDRIVVANGGLEQPFRVVRRRRRDDFQAGPVNEPRLGILRVIQPAADVAAARRADDDRHRGAAAVSIAQRRGLIDDLIEAAGDEVRELHFRDRTIPAHAPRRC